MAQLASSALDLARAIKKLKVFDSRLLPPTPVYGIEKGATSVVYNRYQASTATVSQQNYQIPFTTGLYVPRLWFLRQTMVFDFTVAINAALAMAGDLVLVPGRDFAWAPFPATRMQTVLTLTLNSQQIALMVPDALDIMTRMSADKKNDSIRLQPCALERYMSMNDAYAEAASTFGGFGGTIDSATKRNGCDLRWRYVASNGGDTTAAPVWDGVAASVHVYIEVTTIEPLCVSPNIWSDMADSKNAYAQLKQAQISIQMQSPMDARIIRTAPLMTGRTVSGLTFIQGAQAMTNCFIEMPTLTPPADLPKADAIVIPYMDYQASPSIGPLVLNAGVPFWPAANAVRPVGQQIVSAPVVVNQMPDFFIISARPPAGRYLPVTPVYPAPMAGAPYPVGALDTLSQADWKFDITSIQVNFNNNAGQCVDFKKEYLWELTRRNGWYDMPFAQWDGIAATGRGTPRTSALPGEMYANAAVCTTGPTIVLRPSDFGVPYNLAPGLAMNYTFTVTAMVNNLTATAQPVELQIVQLLTGFVITSGGATTKVMSVLTDGEITNSETDAPYIGRSDLDRLVGGISRTAHSAGRLTGWQKFAHESNPTPASSQLAAAARALPSAGGPPPGSGFGGYSGSGRSLGARYLGY